MMIFLICLITNNYTIFINLNNKKQRFAFRFVPQTIFAKINYNDKIRLVMFILGLNAFTHDASAVLLYNGKIIAYCQEERFTRIKHDANFPWNSINFCLKEAGISLSEIDYAAFSWKPFEKLIPRFFRTFYNLTGSYSRLKSQSSKWLDILKVKSLLRKKGFKGKFYFVNHHDAHAAACFYSSSFASSAILVIDGVGEYATTSLYEGKGNSIKLLQQFYYPHSLGLFYAAITEFLGFRHNDGEGKVMGLAAYGEPIFYEKMKKCFSFNKKIYEINTAYFDFTHNWISSKFIKEFGLPRTSNKPLDEFYCNIAASAQNLLEDIILELCKYIKTKSKEKNLCFTGGVALNCQANYLIYKKAAFENYYFFPVAYDAGTSLGAALFLLKNIINYKEDFEFPNVFWGPDLKKEDIMKLAKKYYLKIIESPDIYKDIAKALAEGKIVGWCFGKAEIGPRALGNRSILADPRKAISKDLVNKKIKKREAFRPFAPTILSEKAALYFGENIYSPYMMMSVPIIPSKAEEIPAVVHKDGTCRLQTLDKSFNEDFYKLLFEFYKLTNCPVLLNTSFNKAGEPMVCQPEDIIKSFIDSDLDLLAISGFIIYK